MYVDDVWAGGKIMRDVIYTDYHSFPNFIFNYAISEIVVVVCGVVVVIMYVSETPYSPPFFRYVTCGRDV